MVSLLNDKMGPKIPPFQGLWVISSYSSCLHVTSVFLPQILNLVGVKGVPYAE